ncbi:MAG: M1 family metallopeptidase, partial [Alteraurantiacibacter sp.]|nr:M1 family metallopeptidase [Alteraurantiacibacter sp.]
MTRLLAAIAALFLAPLAACADATEERMVAPILTTNEALDDFTFARPHEARVTHVSLDLTLDFAAKDISGTARLDIAAAEGAQEIVLDSNGLEISGITGPDGRALEWHMGERVEGKGEPLTVTIGNARQITITYSAAPNAEALQWLSPEQTANGTHPFLFSQGQAILNRSWIPTQDSPGIRQTWDARITLPADLKVVMSGIIRGESEDAPAAADGTAQHTYRFVMDKPVAPYLIAIAAGNIAFAELGPRSGVWAEPAMLEAARAELVDTEAMIDTAEDLYGDYRWGRYDMIVLPPSFPYGGMENPVMTFLTPTFIAGDRSLTGLVAHELAHSWSGNLVTYASWRDGWLNEGVTTYIESRISEAVFGPKRAMQERALSFAAVEEAIATHGADSPMTALRTPPELNPLEYDSAIIYDKGALFLHTLEVIIGRDRFDPWLRQWFDRHAFQPATSEMFIADLRANLIRDDAVLDEALMLEEWVYGTGLPANAARPDAAAFAQVDAAAKAYAASGALDAAAWRGWSTAERMRFLQKVPQQRSAAQLAALDEAFGLSATGNNEIRFLWLELALRNRYAPAVSQAEEFLSRVGRNKFVTPLYRVLSEQGEWGLAIARPLYARTRSSY